MNGFFIRAIDRQREREDRLRRRFQSIIDQVRRFKRDEESSSIDSFRIIQDEDILLDLILEVKMMIIILMNK